MRRTAFGLLLALAAPAAAEVHPNTAPGFPVEQSFHVGEIDNVNLFNGSLTLTIPIGPSYPVNGGLSYGLKLVYNANPWTFSTVTTVHPDGTEATNPIADATACSNAGLGWRLSLGEFEPPCQQPDANGGLSPHVYQDENGTDHLFYPTLHQGDPEDAPLAGVAQVLYTRDGSYLRLKVLTGGTRKLEYPDGTVRTFDTEGRLTEIRDPFNNTVTVSYLNAAGQPAAARDTTAEWILSDSHGRIHRVLFSFGPQDYPDWGVPIIDRIELTAFNSNTPAVYEFDYESRTIGRACPSNLLDDDEVKVPLLTGVTLPDGSAWKIDAANGYVTALPANNRCTDHAGNLTSLALPTLGRLEWTWQTYQFPQISPKSFLNRNSGVAARTMRNPNNGVIGTWTYAQAPEPGQTYNASRQVSTTVTDPLSHRTVHYFSVAEDSNNSATGWSLGDYSLPFTRNNPISADGVTLNLSRQVFKAGSATAVRSEYVLYERELSGPSFGSNSSGAADNANRNRRMVRSRTVYNDDGASFAGVISSQFDGLGHYRRQETEGNFPGTNLRVQLANYNPARGTYTIDPVTGVGSGYSVLPPGSAWVLETMTQMWEQEAGATVFNELCYSPGSATLTRKRIRRQETQGNKDLITVYGLQNGNVASESFYGGDAQTVSTGDLCSLPLPAAPEYQIDHTYLNGVRKTSQYSGTNHKLLDNTIDFNTGLVSSSTDSTGLVTSYEYDALGRMTWSKPQSGHGSWTQFEYTAANPANNNARASVTVRRRGNGSKSAPVLAVDLMTFDYFGRVLQEQKELPSGLYARRETLYDQAGNKDSVSEWTTGNPVHKTQFSGYDPFGRPSTVTAPDAHSVTLTYSGARQVERTVSIATAQGVETASKTTEIYDRHGRLLSVTEPSGSGGADVTTTYGYDVGNRLASVSTNAGGGLQQSRAFNYDRAGLLLDEKHPEKGPDGNEKIFYSRYDSRGHVLRKTDGPNELIFSYDKAERLRQVHTPIPNQPNQLLKDFVYATANGAGEWGLGKLRQASRYNYITLGTAEYKAQVMETYTYGGLDGRVSRRNTALFVDDVPRESFTQGFSYNVLGLTSSLEYPTCTHAGCTQPAPAIFADVPVGHSAQREIEGIYKVGVTTGCAANPLRYCPEGTVTRAEMAAFLIRASSPPGYTPPACVTPTFADVPCSYWASAWIEELYRRGITTGCLNTPLRFCPENQVTNAEMAAFLLRAKEGAGYQPPPCSTAPFLDVPHDYWACAWISEEARRQISAGCGNGNFCPETPIVRWQMAGLLARTFDIPSEIAPTTARTIQYAYTSGLLTSVKAGGATTYGTISYHPNLLVSQVSHGNGVTETQGNDPYEMRRPASLSAWGPYASWSSGAYAYDGAGNIKTIGASWFTYDKVSRLVTASLNDSPTGGGTQKQQSYTFDPFGNLTNIAGSPGRAVPTDSKTNRLNSPATAYDAAGNLTSWNGAVYQYDRFNQMIRVVSGSEDWAYVYTADDERFWSYQTKASGSFSRWTLRDLGGKVLREYLSDAGRWSVGTDYIYRDGSLLAAETQTGRRHFHLDHLGTPRLITRASGYKAAYHVYYPFGEELTAFNQDSERMKFTGHERDLGSPAGAGDDLDYMHARHNSPVTGRFLSVDPVIARESVRKPKLWNRYSYVAGNPLKYFDPTGEVLRLIGDTSKALSDLRNTVPPEDRIFLRLKKTKTGDTVLDERLAASRSRSSGSKNFQMISDIASSSRVVELSTSSPSFAITNMRGNTATVNFGGITGLQGVTLPEGGLSARQGVTQVFVDPGLGALLTARTTAHEVAHAWLFIGGRPHAHEPTQDRNGQPIPGSSGPSTVNGITRGAAEEAGQNYDPFYALQ